MHKNTNKYKDLKVDIYPVGWLSSFRRAYRHFIHPVSPLGRKQGWRELQYSWKYTIGRIKKHNWRAVKNSFNGYLAEPYIFPEGDYRRCCGTGWTRKRALRSLYRRLP